MGFTGAIIGWLKGLAAAVLAALGVWAAVKATRHRDKADALDNRTEAELRTEVTKGTGEAKRRAGKALAHIERGRAAEQRADKLITKGAEKDATVESIVDRWRARSRR